jgi:lysophospholipase L1-like esterase
MAHTSHETSERPARAVGAHRIPARWRRRAALAGAAVAMPLLAMTALTPVAVAAAPVGYVAMGDSYAAGPLIPDQSLSPLGCLRSDHNYAHLAASALGLALTDVSCSGATTDDITAAQSTSIGTNPPQDTVLGPGTGVVTLQMGGNDIGFTSIIEGCATVWPFGSPCKNKYDPGGNDQLLARINATAPKIAAAIRTIKALATHATVFVVGYGDILPGSGIGCWPVMPFAFADISYLNGTELELNAMLAHQAAANGAVYVDTYTPSEGHNSCTAPWTRWIEPVVPLAAAAPVHPNATGMQNFATVVEGAMRSHGL